MLQRLLTLRKASKPIVEQAPPCLGTRLKSFFDDVTVSSPMPDRLVKLADALEVALERGELRGRRDAGRR